MATPPPALPPRLQLARALRERFLAEAGKAAQEISGAVQERLTTLMDELVNAREAQLRRDTWMAYKRSRPLWVDGTMKAWRECLDPPKQKKSPSLESAGLELVGTEVVENKILASRLVLAVNEKVLPQLDDLRVRIRFLENIEDLEGNDLLRPEVLVLLMVEQWAQSGMPAESWPMVNEVVQKLLIERLIVAYKNANDLLISKGVMPTIELKDRVKASVRAPQRPRPLPTAPGIGQPNSEMSPSGYGDVGYGTNPGGSYAQAYAPTGHAALGGAVPQPGGRGVAGMDGGTSTGPGGGGYGPTQQAGMDAGGGAPPSGGQRSGGGFFGGRLGWGGGAASAVSGNSGPQGVSSSAPTPFWRQSSGSHSMPGQAYGAGEETRMLTATTPLARARSRAQGVIGQIRRLFVSHGGGDFGGTAHHAPSPALAAAIAPGAANMVYAPGGTMYEDYSPAGVARVAGDLREKSSELKKKAETKGEKATIEIVALMFQAILAEERIPPGIRVWFARLQMPVLRVALEDPDFFGTADHPARQLIDRMGSCVMGFDASGVQGGAMETEIKRIVQVIEQYPETGKKVYQIVFEEFQKFLSKFLTEKGANQKVVSVAQQVEQKETLAIQYTIEMRNMLKDMPVRDEIRDFLFKVWAEVLAVAAVRKGPQHADTLVLKKSATDLIWAASAKPNRADRAKVIQDLPNLLLRLRSGMTLLAMAPSEQETNVKRISDTLADAFMSKTQAIPQAQIDAMAQRLGNLEDFVSEDGMGDLPLDAESIEMMLGIDASAIEVVANGGSKPTAAMLAWAQELQLGSWFTLDHNNQITQVQFAWRSDRKHLNLFASSAGKSYLIQGGRLAAYLQAGLLLPQEEEALTVRATRDALAKLEANPERLLA
ncbi:hypothetical protein CHU94_15325 [Rhodoferax sp. TH121]|uniref:DUF1631 family protein n=1 Tax=Rhodoferax sp. TH121 TaxID=2022803 RepID=UPI000B95DF69|nr:DUF1631 family protein [Rhodoferax sp. TH121]OYQ38809.1 hypothetical protein CHU94_15325 [Rhodoferax sp. TH121]